MVANILPADPSLSHFSEHGHVAYQIKDVAYQIKGNHQMQQHGSK